MRSTSSWSLIDRDTKGMLRPMASWIITLATVSAGMRTWNDPFEGLGTSIMLGDGGASPSPVSPLHWMEVWLETEVAQHHLWRLMPKYMLSAALKW